jgi:hypothetical protein
VGLRTRYCRYFCFVPLEAPSNAAEDDLGFQKGDLIDLVKEENEHWSVAVLACIGILTGNVGTGGG